MQRIHPDDKALAQQVINRVSQTGTDFEHEYRLLMADGRVKHLHAIAHAVQNARGDRVLLGAVTDITERKTAEEKIRRSSTPIVGVYIADFEGACLVDANEAFLRMLQYSREELVSRRMRRDDLTPPEWHERDERARTQPEGHRGLSAIREGVLPERWQPHPRTGWRRVVRRWEGRRRLRPRFKRTKTDRRSPTAQRKLSRRSTEADAHGQLGLAGSRKRRAASLG